MSVRRYEGLLQPPCNSGARTLQFTVVEPVTEGGRRQAVRVVDRWTGRRAMALCNALRMSMEEFAHRLGAAPRTVAYWDSRPDSVPTPSLQAALDTLYGSASEADLARFTLAIGGDNEPAAAPGPPHPGDTEGSDGLGELFMVAAQECASDAVLRAAGGLGVDSLADLHDQVTRVARCYSVGRPVEVFGTARRTRDLAQRLAECSRRPSELADLYALSGQAAALMSSIAFDLGHWDAAVTLAQSAGTYAELAGHTSLQAWTLGLRATLANWGHRPVEALRHTERALSIAPAGAPRVRLLHIASRTHALRGDAAAAAEVLAQAQVDRDTAESRPDELHDEVRGEFRFDDARAAACAGAAWLGLGDGRQAERYTLRALAYYEALPVAARPFSPVNGAWIDTAAARLLHGDLAGAGEALSPVLTLEPGRRNAALSGRLRSVEQTLRGPAWQPDAAAAQLAETIEGWLADTAAQPLPLADVY
jgi:hypothetical protein